MKPQLTTSSRLKVKRSKTGLGLFALNPITKGQTVIEYIGPILNNKEADEKAGKYLFEVSSRKTIDGSGRKNIARYINHSCRPNCEPNTKKGRVFIVAKKNIFPGEEITYDYGKDYFTTFIKPHGCKCPKCANKPAVKR